LTARRAPKDVAASVRARLYAVARERGVELQRVLTEFAVERLLYRLGASPHRDRFVLKGATLFRLWSDERSRATWDVDFLGRGASGVQDVAGVVGDLCGIAADDGLQLDAASVTAEEIRSPDEYGGVRVRLAARLGKARIPLQVDVGFGDAVVPPPRRESFPTLLDHPAPRVLVYPPEAVVAEKLEAMISLGATNSRMKDFYDVYLLASTMGFDGDALALAIRATFERRQTLLPAGEPSVLAAAFLADPARQTQWRAFLRRGGWRRRSSPPSWRRSWARSSSRFSPGRARIEPAEPGPREDPGPRAPARDER
jgi:predicted nucleotidyltransferase component of viral defense system